MSKPLNRLEFIEKCKRIHGEKYNIIGEYVDNKTKIEVFCNKKDLFGNVHGIFTVRPNDLTSNHIGCPKCGGTKKSNTNEWIEKAKYVHNNYFSYEKSEYKGSNNKIIVTCPVHGDFEVKANNHLNGYNCKKCQLEGIKHNITKLPKTNSSTKKLTNDTFIFRAKMIHPNFDFSKCNYINHKTHVTIICPIHGEFKISPLKLLKGQGCAMCSNNKKLTTEEFIERSKLIHGDLFYYNKCEYISTHKNVILTCKKCNSDFKVLPSNHLHQKHGCPYCNISKLENDMKQFLIEQNIQYEQQKRFKWLGTQSLDFYLPKYNVAIECQGEQHFKSIDFFGGKEILKLNIERDERKKHLCEENDVKLLYFSNLGINYPYNVIENKEELLNIIKSFEKPKK